jgi:rhodanese-related sulfurtransferase
VKVKTLEPKQVSVWTGRIIDVRNPDEFAGERLPGAECVPLGTLAAAVSGWDRAEPLLVMCKSGARARQAVGQLKAAGFTNVCTVEGGLDACKREGVKVIVNRAPIPMYRQVMIVAGLLLLAGLGLSFVHPAFLLIDAFVATGLTFAGFSGFCPMARLLEKMPWNSVSCCTGGSCS